MFRTFAQFLFKLIFPEGQGGMKETFGNSGGEGGFIFLHKNGNSGEVGGLSWNSLRGGGMDIFWNYTILFAMRAYHQTKLIRKNEKYPQKRSSQKRKASETQMTQMLPEPNDSSQT